MSSELDLRPLAVSRPPLASALPPRRPRWLTRYALPAALLAGFGAIVAYAARDYLLPRRTVAVIPVRVSQVAAAPAAGPLFKAAGWVEPRPTRLRAAALTGGVVQQLLVVEDQAVEAGEPVALLVPDDAQLALEAAEAAERLEQANVDQTRAALAAAEVDFDQPTALQAALAEAQAQAARTAADLADLPFRLRAAEARSRLARAELEAKTSATGAVSGLAVAQARSQLDALSAEIEQLHARRETLAAQHAAETERAAALALRLKLKNDERRARAQAQAALDAAEARLSSARVKLAEARLRRERMTVRAPAAGRVLELEALPGTALSARDPETGAMTGGTVVSLYQPESLQVRVDVRFDDLPHVFPGQAALVASPALPTPLAGRVLFLTSKTNIQKNTLEVKVALDAPPAIVKPDMLVDVTFLAPTAGESAGSSSAERVSVPGELVHTVGGASQVWVADRAEGLARLAPVRIARSLADGFVELEAGLDVSSRLIANPPADLRDGERIRILGEP